MITQVGKITIYVGSQDVAVKFWVEIIGFHVTVDQKVGSVRWLEVSPPGNNLTSLVLYDKALMAQVRPEAVAHPAVIFNAREIDSFWNYLRSNSVQVSELQHYSYGKMFNFSDPDGNEYMVRE
jgi:lactoylglutathione lyase